MKVALGFKGQHRQVAMADGVYIREPGQPYGCHFDRETVALRANNTIAWQTILQTTEIGSAYR
jgi:hypothetical protein